MTRMCRPGTAWLLLTLSLLATGARATHRTDFFDISKKPVVEFDKATMTWDMRNDAVERVIRYDPKAGSLHTVSLTDRHRDRHLVTVPDSEGSISFLSALMETPRPITTGWKSTDSAPPTNWASPTFNDLTWKITPLPFKTDQENKTWWFRYRIPAGRMAPNRAYALLLDHAIDDEAEVYVDGAQVAKYTTADQPWNHAYQIDLLSRSQMIAIKLTGHSRPNGLLGNVSIVEVGTAPPPLDLNADWKYMIHSINANEDGSKVLTISLSGLHKYEGFDLDVSYQIYPGEEPTLAKWFLFVSHRKSRFLIDQAVYERWMLPGSSPQVQKYAGTSLTAFDSSSRDGMMTAVLSPLGASEPSADGKSVATVLHPYYLVRTDARQLMPKSLVSFYHGGHETGAFLYQLYTGQYVARATPTSVPPVYNTWFGYLADINAATCEKIIPLAEAIGAKIFVIDDGWQTNNLPDTGRYGDWVVNRAKDKFPLGLTPISTLVREHNMRFGLWTAPIMVNEKSQAALQHNDWLLRTADDGRVRQWDNTWGMCFTSGWEENYTQSMQDLCRELTVTYLKLDSGLLSDGCVEPSHDHPVGHSIAGQIDHWSAFCDKMRKVDPNFILDRGWESGPEVTGWQDEGWFGDWEIGYDPKRQADPRWWYKNADIYRQTLYDLTWTRPAFTIAWETPCHIPTNPVDLNALEYHFTSIGAYICNVELHGKLDQMSQDESKLVRKWVDWNVANRPWLAYAQPIASLGRPADPRKPGETPHVDGVMHLRNALDNRYGYICLWNPSDKPAKASVAFDPTDYYIRMNLNTLQIRRMKDGKSVGFTTNGSTVSLKQIDMAPLSWEIFEVRQNP